MKNPVRDTATSGAHPTPSPVVDVQAVSQNTGYQRFLQKALALGTEESIAAKWARRKLLLKILAPVDALTRTGPWKRAGALALGWSPLILATPVIYSRLGFNALIFGGLLPASLVTAILFWIVKSLQKSKWRPIENHPEDYAELERVIKEGRETHLLRDAILQSGRSLRGADLTLLVAYNKKRRFQAPTK